MIKRFGFKNFSSFKDGAEISFELPSSPNETSTIIGIKGANGSGKTNILKAITFLYCFCSKRMTTSEENSDGSKKIAIPIDRFFHSEEPAEFYVELLIDGTTYYYELDLTEHGIIREELRRKKPKKEVTCIVREGHKVTKCLKEFEELKSLKLKLDQSIITLVSDYDFYEPMEDLEELRINFLKILYNVGADGYRTQSVDDFFKVSKFYHEKNDVFEFTKEVLISVDSGLSDIIIEETTDSATGETIYFPVFYHDNGEYDYAVGLNNESMGTKSLFLYLYRYWITLTEGSLLILDEFDTHLHAMILPELVELFDNPSINKLNAQLMFTAHNTEIIDSLGRYKSVLVNKEENESYCYRLDEVSMLRNDRSLSPYYMKGKIGGVPTNIQGLAKKLAHRFEAN
ncbi:MULTISPECIES: ATP/GTP-binding protein [unclassified Vibrio]|uniref:AAA family ATPase n=1 Tax=unclassified Vibrio TaxID=2614977 RepID=UPI000C844751|nr:MULTISPECIES: ATP-binding protein [unclassified Vibrio]PMI19256.1 hypothetical protein BCU50_19625 [Vibrio sp. 10N.286.46.E10]PMI87716.1 hypothetical protein BCU34_05105 [Vibrio sp. 10N.286.45.E10]PTP08387.1 hypothetical protein CWO17_06245 [Vibrio sp. 10N.286.45.A3]PTQ24854.1 hypothetical protein CWO24_06415 [Vibrio sp. 10N.286.46.E10]TKE85760.1 hypothetical protein FCV56_07390 [Vibrio sp. F12]